MIKTIELKNYRCYQDTKMNFQDLTIIIGSNNSGKSTVIEALRIVSMVANKYKTATYMAPPSSLQLPDDLIGIKVSVNNLKLDLRGIVNLKKKANAVLSFLFTNNVKVVITINSELIFATIYDENNLLVKTRAQAKQTDIPSIRIMPQLGLLKEEETLLTQATVKDDMDTYLSSRHFRNELLLLHDEKFAAFQNMAQKTWQGLQIGELSYDAEQSELISLMIEDTGFSAEIGRMGSGLQMWLQMVWFLCKSENSAILILDEPDLYMHPDLQRKVLSMIKTEARQVIIATHSVEIISDVEPRCILMLDKSAKQMSYATDMKAVQNIIDHIGSAQNLALIRIITAKKCIFIEQKDIKLLAKFYARLYPHGDASLESLPCIPLGGWTRLGEALETARLFDEETQGNIKTICILDRDYHLVTEIDEFKRKAKENHLNLIIWKRKEIENYILIPRAIFQLTQLDQDQYLSFCDEYEAEIDKLKERVIDQYANEIALSHKKITVLTANQQAREIVNIKWNGLVQKLKLINGKEGIKITDNWLQNRYHKSCSISQIIAAINPGDIPSELKIIIDLLAE